MAGFSGGRPLPRNDAESTPGARAGAAGASSARRVPDRSGRRPSPRGTLGMSLTLFAFWVTLSGKIDALHLLMGAASAVLITIATHPLRALPPAIDWDAIRPSGIGSLRLWFGYGPWLVWQVVVASFQVAYVVLHPRLPIRPSLIRFRTPLPHGVARLALANSITLTPGTVTLDVRDDEYLIHALTAESAASLQPPEGEGAMRRRVAALFPLPPSEAAVQSRSEP
jgi:multicomponent Na+:H+ antiporter subunit E